MKKKTILLGVLCILLLAAAFPIFTSGLMTASASGLAQVTVPAPEVTVVPATAVPDSGTGGNPTFFLPGWLILVLVGFVGLVLLLALLRPVFVTTSTPTHTHTHDHNP